MQAVQRLYRMRLDFALEPARRLLRETGDDDLIEPQRQAAIDVVRRLDYEHLLLLAEIHEEFEATWRPAERDAVVGQRLEIAAVMARAEALVIAGGHVAVLLNRLRLFSLVDLFGNLPILAWSAGAMALGERIVLFHDSPPQGPGNAEVLDQGLGLHQDVIPLPGASQRLRLDDQVRVSLFARRFAPDLCVPLDSGMSVHFRSGRWFPGRDSRVLTLDGRVANFDRELAA
jgi:hypothetical protein